MALIGSLDVLKKQIINTKLISALDFLQNTDLTDLFAQLITGNSLLVEIEGKTIYSKLEKYTTKSVNEIMMEGHKKYIDIQYVISGKELINNYKALMSPFHINSRE